MNKRFTLPFLAVLAALAVGLLFLLPGGLLQAQQNNMTTVSFAENGEDAVATFTATDPEGAMPITWTVLAGDASTDDIDGVGDADRVTATTSTSARRRPHLRRWGDDHAGDMSVSPDFENPPGSDATDNTYKVVVVASDAETGGGMMGYHKVTVKVTNVAETGKVTWGVDHDANNAADTPTLMQFQVGAILTASVTDGDIKGTDKTVAAVRGDVEADPTWRWYSRRARPRRDDDRRSRLGHLHCDHRRRGHVPAGGGVLRCYGQRRPGNRLSDLGLPRAGGPSGDNRLKFAPAAGLQGGVRGQEGHEGQCPGDGHGQPRHGQLHAGWHWRDELYFEIDQKTGQITTMVDLNFDETDTDAADQCTVRNSCVVSVKATDASGSAPGTAATNVFVDATVTIKITDVNEKPMFTGGPTAITVPENMTALAAAADVTYEAKDQDELNLTYDLREDDASKFNLSASRVLSFKDEPDYEMPTDRNKDNVYEVTVRASDGRMVRRPDGQGHRHRYG